MFAAAAGLPVLGAAAGAGAEAKTLRWRGTALGAKASLTLRHPDEAEARAPGALLDTLEIRDRALATSTANGTLLEPAGRISHILDPRPGPQAKGLLAATVVATGAADADALSTALLADARILDRAVDFRGLGIERIVALGRDGAARDLALG